MRIVWDNDALTDLEGIYHFYAQKSQNAAVRIYNKILDETKRLSTFLEMAPIEAMITSTEYIFRSLIVDKGHFKVIYFIYSNDQEDIIYISHVWDCRRNPDSIRQI